MARLWLVQATRRIKAAIHVPADLGMNVIHVGKRFAFNLDCWFQVVCHTGYDHRFLLNTSLNLL